MNRAFNAVITAFCFTGLCSTTLAGHYTYFAHGSPIEAQKCIRNILDVTGPDLMLKFGEAVCHYNPKSVQNNELRIAKVKEAILSILAKVKCQDPSLTEDDEFVAEFVAELLRDVFKLMNEANYVDEIQQTSCKSLKPIFIQLSSILTNALKGVDSALDGVGKLLTGLLH